MYSPVKNGAKDNDRAAAKEKRKVQLSTLLVNKFRNKYKVDANKDSELDQFIK